jgi:hypothetical protein
MTLSIALADTSQAISIIKYSTPLYTLISQQQACYDVSKDWVALQTGWSRKDIRCQVQFILHPSRSKATINIPKPFLGLRSIHKL